jgi:hypothetical protein
MQLKWGRIRICRDGIVLVVEDLVLEILRAIPTTDDDPDILFVALDMGVLVIDDCSSNWPIRLRAESRLPLFGLLINM